MRTPALDAWREERAAGKRDPYERDALWRAACVEADAVELVEYKVLVGLFRDEAKRIIREAVRRQQSDEGA